MVWWQVLLMVAVVASTTDAVNYNKLIQEQDLSNTDLDTEQLDDLDYFGVDSLPYGIDPAGNIVNGTRSQTNVPDPEETITARFSDSDGCNRSIACERAGGFCVKRGRDCDGTIDRSGCKGTRCKCCVPDGITWLRAGADRFFWVNKKMNWTDAQTHCKRLGGDTVELYQPRNSTKVSQYLQDNFPETYQWSWLGGRGNGTNMIWIPSGDVMTIDLPWNNPSWNMGQTANTSCLWLISNVGWEEGVLNNQDGSCSRANSFYALCG